MLGKNTRCLCVNVDCGCSAPAAGKSVQSIDGSILNRRREFWRFSSLLRILPPFLFGSFSAVIKTRISVDRLGSRWPKQPSLIFLWQSSPHRSRKKSMHVNCVGKLIRIQFDNIKLTDSNFPLRKIAWLQPTSASWIILRFLWCYVDGCSLHLICPRLNANVRTLHCRYRCIAEKI